MKSLSPIEPAAGKGAWPLCSVGVVHLLVALTPNELRQ